MKRAGRGERQAQVLALVKRWEREKRLWTNQDVAAELGISLAQVGGLIAVLSLRGSLVRKPRTVVIPDALSLSDATA